MILGTGVAYYGLHDYDHAIADQTTAISLRPDFANAYFLRGMAYNDKPDLAHAVPDFEKALSMTPPSAPAYKGMQAVAVAKRALLNSQPR